MSDPKKPLDRFQHLERERSGSLEEKVAPHAASRFGAVEQGGAPVQAPAGSGVQRFQAPTGPDEVMLESNSAEEQPFVKCAGCGTEWGKFAQFCGTCGVSLETDEQRAYNAQVWAERRVQQQAEHAQLAGREAARMADADHQARLRHHDAEALALEARRRAEAELEFERQRPGNGGSTGGGLTRFMQRSPLLALLDMVPEPWNWAVGAAMFLVPVALIKWAPHEGRLWWTGVFTLVAEVVLLLPPSFWLSGRRRWYDTDGW